MQPSSPQTVVLNILSDQPPLAHVCTTDTFSLLRALHKLRDRLSPHSPTAPIYPPNVSVLPNPPLAANLLSPLRDLCALRG